MPVTGGLRRCAMLMVMKVVPVSMRVNAEFFMVFAVKMIHGRYG
jgi:hypothetical protein